jgi:hypothetical protein
LQKKIKKVIVTFFSKIFKQIIDIETLFSVAQIGEVSNEEEKREYEYEFYVNKKKNTKYYMI